MATKIYIDQGHNPQNPNAGAEGNGYREQDITYRIGVELADLLEGLLDGGAELARENAGLRGGIVSKFSGLSAELDDLSLLYDDHALSVGNGDTRAVRNNIITCFFIRGALADPLLPLYHQYVICQ